MAGWRRSSGPEQLLLEAETLEGQTTSCVWIEARAEGRGQGRAEGRGQRQPWGGGYDVAKDEERWGAEDGR